MLWFRNSVCPFYQTSYMGEEKKISKFYKPLCVVRILYKNCSKVSKGTIKVMWKILICNYQQISGLEDGEGKDA